MAGKKGMKHYSLEIRQEVVDKHLREGVSTWVLCKQYGIDSTQVQNWCRWQREYEMPKQLTGKKRGRPRTSGGEETLEQKIKRLEMENELLKKFNELLREEETELK